MMTVYESDVLDAGQTDLRVRLAEVVTWRGRRALQLDGLALVRGFELADATLEVDVCAEGPAYPGVVFHATDVLNHELAYAVPHCSEAWDAVQYDPVFHGSNTWQLYHGQGYQQAAEVPTGKWFHLRVDVFGTQASVSVDDQPRLVVQLAHGTKAGRVGLWTYRPAYFSGLRISEYQQSPQGGAALPQLSEDVVREWFVEGFGRVSCEPNGALNLNRYLPLALGEVRLVRRFEMSRAGEVELSFGFSDELSLALDGDIAFEGTNTFVGFDSYQDRGYVSTSTHSISWQVEPGVHQLTAGLKVTEGFGWGLGLALQGEDIQLLPAVGG
jgi:hypothetical protein